MAATDTTSDDEVTYPSYVYPQTHPDRLATIATLLGMNPAPEELDVYSCGGHEMVPTP